MKGYEQQAKWFQALAHPTRLHILEILTRGPVCVCELAELTGKRQPYISQHLANLRNAGLVTTDRQGWSIFYQLDKTNLAELEQFISALFPLVRNTWPANERSRVS